MQIAAVLWDFGGVVSTSPFESFARYERDNALPNGLLRQLNATNPDHNAWARFERSEFSALEFAAAYEAEAAALGHRIDAMAVLGCLAGELRPEMLIVIRRLREAGLRTGCITNNVATMHDGPGWAAELRMEELFEVVLESARLGIRKPDPRIYQMACDALEVTPAETAFLDDLGVNLKPARAMGMTTIKVEDPAVALAELEAATGLSLR